MKDEELEEFKKRCREDALEMYPNLDSMTQEEKLKEADKLLDKILDGARAWQDPELNPPEAKPFGELMEEFVNVGRKVVQDIRTKSTKH